MKMRLLFRAACLLACSATSGFAATFSVGGADYDITTISGNFNELRSVLIQQVWWGDVNTAEEFTTSVAFSFGEPNALGQYVQGPLFAFGEYTFDVDAVAWIDTISSDGTINYHNPLLGTESVWAVSSATLPVSAVPLPAGGLLLLSAFGGVAALKRRKKRAA